MKKAFRKLRGILLIMLCVVLIVPCMNVSAASQKQKALSAYKKWLSKSSVCVLKKGTQYYDDYNYTKNVYKSTKSGKVKFALAYIDNDKIPELILYTKVGYVNMYGILTYKNGKIRRVYSSNGDDKILGYYYKTGYFLERSYTDGTPYHDSYYKKNGAKIKKNFYVFNYGYDNQAEYKVGSKYVSKSTFNSRLKSALKNKSMKKLKFYKNTAANRKKMLK